MNLLEIVEIRDKLKAELAVVEKFLEIAKARGCNGSNGSVPNAGGGVIDTIRAGAGAGQRNLPLSGAGKEYGKIAGTVREGIRLCAEKYSILDLFVVLERINKPLTKVQISTVLNRFVRKGEARVFRKGKGNRATIFRKIMEPTPAG